MGRILPNLTQKSFVSYNDPVLIEVRRGRSGGTYFHPKLALRFAQWCSAEFAVEVDFWLDDMLQGKLPNGYQYGNKVLPFETEIPQAYRGLGEGAIN